MELKNIPTHPNMGDSVYGSDLRSEASEDELAVANALLCLEEYVEEWFHSPELGDPPMRTTEELLADIKLWLENQPER